MGNLRRCLIVAVTLHFEVVVSAGKMADVQRVGEFSTCCNYTGLPEHSSFTVLFLSFLFTIYHPGHYFANIQCDYDCFFPFSSLMFTYFGKNFFLTMYTFLYIVCNEIHEHFTHTVPNLKYEKNIYILSHSAKLHSFHDVDQLVSVIRRKFG